MSDPAPQPIALPAPPRAAQIQAAEPKRSALRADVQFLRTVAVTAVVINHLSPWHLPGGFLGVDIFFVISGFLITGHLVKERHKTGTINLRRFYVRRARRLLPAALTVILASLLLTVLFLPNSRWAANAWESFASAAYFQNWALFFSQTDYFAQQQPHTLVQHYWSLSVEEQFYLVWPCLLLLVYTVAGRFRFSRFRFNRLLLFTAALFAVFFVVALWQLQLNQSSAYFSTLARAWEFMLGACCVAAWPALQRWLQARGAAAAALTTLLQLAGYGMIAVSFVVFSGADPIPGFASLLPTSGVVLVILAGPQTVFKPLAFAVENRVSQYIAKRSYSIYLWHWPLIVTLPFVFGQLLQLPHKILVVLLTLVAAELTYRFIEEPARRRLFTAQRPRVTFAAIAASIAIVAAASTAVFASGQQRIDVNLRASQKAIEQIIAAGEPICLGAEAAAHPAVCAEVLYSDSFITELSEQWPWSMPDENCVPAATPLAGAKVNLVCDYSTGAADAVEVMLVGDSHAEHLFHTFSMIAAENNWRLHFSALGSCYPVVLPQHQISAGLAASDCQTYAASTADFVAANNLDMIFVISASKSQGAFTQGLKEADIIQNAAENFAAWAAQGARVTVLRDVPFAGQELGPTCVELNFTAAAKCSAPESEVLQRDYLYEATTTDAVVTNLGAQRERVRGLQLNDLICQQGNCYGVIGGIPVYFDNDHLARSFAKSMAPELTKRLNKLWDTEYKIPVLTSEIMQ
ncbi:acyltransferase [Leucobacter sp. OH2974_COT-288]|nr:acyltransferase [Leucobacter sp. OH2974_COT-288]